MARSFTPEERIKAAQRMHAARRARAKLEQAAVELPADADPIRIQVWERRLYSPLDETRSEVRLKADPDRQQFALRWVNTAVDTGRFYRAVSVQGWVPVRADELDVLPATIGLTVSPDGFVARGPRAAEVLCKMPRTVYERIQARKAQVALERLKSTSSRLREELSERFQVPAESGVLHPVGGLVDYREPHAVSDLDQPEGALPTDLTDPTARS